ncbi:MAG TPA: hypothetical protein VH539_22420 [Gemmatimonadaceae bacterium]|jgi:hypothetical protein
MFDRTQPGRDTAPLNHSVPSLDGDPRRNKHRHTNGIDRGTAGGSASAKPALTERERRERWPVD